jgi:hypothetical protein
VTIRNAFDPHVLDRAEIASMEIRKCVLRDVGDKTERGTRQSLKSCKDDGGAVRDYGIGCNEGDVTSVVTHLTH